MKYILLLLVAAFHLPLMAQNGAADTNALLDKVVAGIKGDAPVQMDYSYKVFDDEGAPVQVDNGVIYIDNSRYALLMENMKVWCDGESQWSFMRDINEIYITEASSDEAQNLSPLYIMEYYREGYDVSSVSKGSQVVVTLQAADKELEVERVELFVSKENNRLVAMHVYMPEQGRIEVQLDGYAAHCGVDDGFFRCPEEDFPSAEIIDMR